MSASGPTTVVRKDFCLEPAGWWWEIRVPARGRAMVLFALGCGEASVREWIAEGDQASDEPLQAYECEDVTWH